VAEALPDAEIEHVGSTAILGALTKRDLDLLVRVEPGSCDDAVAGLHGLCAVDQPENWTSTFASFRDPRSADPPVGLQLVVADSADDTLFGPFRDALVDDPACWPSTTRWRLRTTARTRSATRTSRRRSSSACWQGSTGDRPDKRLRADQRDSAARSNAPAKRHAAHPNG
jgi:GrpB-like predicted nucleotidyltransferase (UPF0157 family)